MQNIRIRVPDEVMTKLDAKGELYQMEMQKANTYNLPKRSRYYQGQIDVSLLEPGSIDFNKLNDLTTILVAPFDIFGHGLYRYTFEEYCQEIPKLKLNDGARRIFINTKGTNPENFSREFLDFMEYINASTDAIAMKTESERILRIHNRVRKVKQSEKIGVKLMQKWEEIYYEKEAARKEGRAESQATMVRNMLRLEYSIEKIAQCVGISTEEIIKISSENI